MGVKYIQKMADIMESNDEALRKENVDAKIVSMQLHERVAVL